MRWPQALLYELLTDPLVSVQEFWDGAPCDAQSNYIDRAAFRYRKDPYLLALIDRIAAEHDNVLEVGCGQGTDAVTLCQRMRPGTRYHGIDLSRVSIDSARRSALELADRVSVDPRFEFANAENLPYEDCSFDCVFSVGALHHTPDTLRAVNEVRRVLVPGGTAYVLLYRTWSPKLLLAHALRGLQTSLDRLGGRDRSLYGPSRSLSALEPYIGTAVYECLGVPILRSYTRRGIATLFREFPSVTIDPYGPFPSLLVRERHRSVPSALGYLWLVRAVKR